MSKQVEKILKYNPREKSLKALFSIYLDLEFLLKKEQSSDNNSNLEKSYTQKKGRYEPSGWQCLQNVHSIKKKTNIIITEENIVFKNYVKS